jgi:tartrate dehydratase beta subunit/fumarate hydratase class I family protein
MLIYIHFSPFIDRVLKQDADVASVGKASRRRISFDSAKDHGGLQYLLLVEAAAQYLLAEGLV